ncbi:hypothetical protein MHB50_08945 [Siminovitchia sp. FSL H7-0308]|uniref:Uncharacterized protein n=1 Tax=Siminovitchia thermophila TaxID=1245522 RepID=A0ABS2RB58_9BACI|nr:hypothetical protein [Siminovitchia thermophila]MBM7716882.1 hypothetical protein [Siminovitchia thermophila]ONK22050.1 hypothetical protein BLX87_19360 [Bacillus sp. VT-16-64]
MHSEMVDKGRKGSGKTIENIKYNKSKTSLSDQEFHKGAFAVEYFVNLQLHCPFCLHLTLHEEYEKQVFQEEGKGIMI